MKHRSLITTAIIFISATAMGFNVAKDPDKKTCLDCHNEIKAQLKKDDQHYPFAEKQCDACHDKKSMSLTSEGKDLCFTCHSEQKKDYQKKSIHRPVRRGNCTSCHAPHVSGNEYLLLHDSKELCSSCHDTDKSKEAKSIHQPYKKGECDTCHTPHASDHAPLLLSPIAELCGECHDKNDKDLDEKHSGLLKRNPDCVSCHDPHYSDNKNLLHAAAHFPFKGGECDVCHDDSPDGETISLTEEGNELCLMCHEDQNKEGKKGYVHMPFMKDCLSCHSPHVTKHEKLLHEPVQTQCLKCHEDVKDQQKSKVTHPAMTENKCTACHSPHASDSKAMLKGEQVSACVKCHKKMGAKLAKKYVHTIVKKRGCGLCHSAHGSDFPSLLKKKGAAVCTSCHGTKKYSGVERTHAPAAAGKCVLCHDPHGSDHRGLLTGNQSDRCLFCHSLNKKVVQHPVDMVPSKKTVVPKNASLPLGQEGKVECTTCHEPHGGKHHFFLRQSLVDAKVDMCYVCHPTLKKED